MHYFLYHMTKVVPEPAVVGSIVGGGVLTCSAFLHSLCNLKDQCTTLSNLGTYALRVLTEP